MGVITAFAMVLASQDMRLAQEWDARELQYRAGHIKIAHSLEPRAGANYCRKIPRNLKHRECGFQSLGLCQIGTSEMLDGTYCYRRLR